MSSFQLNLSSLTLGAKERLARLDAAGGTFRSLLSPSSSGVGSTALGDGPPPAPSGLSRPAASSGLPSAPGARFSVEHLVASGSGTSGESVVSGGLSGGLLAFVVMPELLASLCCGAVAGGVKFCTLGSDSCTFSTHSKKVDIQVNSLYISTERNSAFSHHHAPVDALSHDQLARLLEESHPKDEWVRLIWGFNQSLRDVDSVMPSCSAEVISILDGATPGHKRKVRYDDDATATALFTPARPSGDDY